MCVVELVALPAAVEIVAGDFNAPESLEAALHDVAALFLVWTAPLTSAPAVMARLADYTSSRRRIVHLSRVSCSMIGIPMLTMCSRVRRL